MTWLTEVSNANPNEKLFATLIRFLFYNDDFFLVQFSKRTSSVVSTHTPDWTLNFGLPNAAAFTWNSKKCWKWDFQTLSLSSLARNRWNPCVTGTGWEMTLSNETKHTFLCIFLNSRESKVHKKFNGVCLSGFCLETMSSSSCCVSNL